MTLLRDLAADAQHPRWGEFVARYRPMMEAYLRVAFPMVEADDLIQETLITLVDKLPHYRYVPEENGAFHNYLTGILRRKALRLCRSNLRRKEILDDYRNTMESFRTPTEEEERAWQESIYEIAIQQIMADETILVRTRQIFARIAINGEKPESVADSLGMMRNAVDRAKGRMMEKLRELVAALEDVDAWCA